MTRKVKKSRQHLTTYRRAGQAPRKAVAIHYGQKTNRWGEVRAGYIGSRMGENLIDWLKRGKSDTRAKQRSQHGGVKVTTHLEPRRGILVAGRTKSGKIVAYRTPRLRQTWR